MKSIIPSEELAVGERGLGNDIPNEPQVEWSEWNEIPDWAIGLMQYRDGSRFWISNDGLRLEEVV